jgi:DNA-binding CsgD family transcriptional regulator/small-conductance mechanosensitive channel
MISWLSDNLIYIIVPMWYFLSAVVLGLCTRMAIHYLIKKRQGQKMTWIRNFVIDAVWNHLLFWFSLLGAYAAVETSMLSPTIKKLVGEGVATLFVLSMMWVVANISERLIKFYLGKTETRQSLTSFTLTAVKVIVIIVGLLVVISIWGAPTEPIIIVLSAFILVFVLLLKNNINSFLAWIDIILGEHIKVGHYIKIGSDEVGRVTHLSWTKTIIKTGDGSLVIIPNHKLMENKIINYGLSINEISTNDVKREPASVSPVLTIDILTDREHEVLKLIGNGATNREIAQELIISEHTVKSHIRSILNKLNMRNRQQAAAYAEREHLLTG